MAVYTLRQRRKSRYRIRFLSRLLTYRRWTKIKEARKEEISVSCEQAIYFGVDVVLTDGGLYHFSMTEKDQLNLFGKRSQLSTGGGLYVLLELPWRGRSHCTMFLLGGICFISLGLINEIIPWEMPLWQQILIGACIVTGLEFVTGCIVDLWLGWDVWDYSGLPGNVLGQICPQFFILWMPAALAAIVLDDWLRYWWFAEGRPHYKIL